jgi:hypothetical protein
MNIFFLSEDAFEAARMQVDKHVVKMILESAQLLSTAHRVLDGDPLPDIRQEELFYRATHKNHPCAKWARESVENYNWLVDHFDALLCEYTHRYNKEHACARMLYNLQSPPMNLKDWDWTPPPSCMPDECKIGSLVDNYREYYREYYRKHKSHMFKWTNREPPQWINE